MLRLLLFWKTSLLGYGGFAVLYGLAAGLSVWQGGYCYYGLVGLTFLASLSILRSPNRRHLWRFARSTWRFRKLSCGRLGLWYAPEVAHQIDLAGYLNSCERWAEELTERFGVSLRRRLLIYMFVDSAEIDHIFETSSHGTALTGGDAILVAANCGDCTVEQLTRHEVAHLFSYYLSSAGPPFKDEGLAVFLEGSWGKKEVDYHALQILLAEPLYPLDWLWSEPAIFCGPYEFNAYVIAGSFSAYLIRRFGWDDYRRFFGLAGPENLDRAFTNTFKMTPAAAERDWRSELMRRRRDFEPDFSRELSETRLKVAFRERQFYRCLEEGNARNSTGQNTPGLTWIMAAAHTMLGQYDQAVSLLDRLIPESDASVEGDALMLRAILYELQGQREYAKVIFRKLLSEPDRPGSWCCSTHRLSQFLIDRSFSEDRLLEFLRLHPVFDATIVRPPTVRRLPFAQRIAEFFRAPGRRQEGIDQARTSGSRRHS